MHICLKYSPDILNQYYIWWPSCLDSSNIIIIPHNKALTLNITPKHKFYLMRPLNKLSVRPFLWPWELVQSVSAPGPWLNQLPGPEPFWASFTSALLRSRLTTHPTPSQRVKEGEKGFTLIGFKTELLVLPRNIIKAYNCCRVLHGFVGISCICVSCLLFWSYNRVTYFYSE